MSEGAFWLADLYGVEIGRVRQQIEKRSAPFSISISYTILLVREQVVHHRNLTFLQLGS